MTATAQRRSRYADMSAIHAPRKVGKAEIRIDEPDQFTRLRAALHGQPLDSERYVRLFVNGVLFMTDAEFERLSNLAIIRAAKGDVLIAGLGIGLILPPIQATCTSVTVVEKSADVIALVADKFPGVRVVHADILDWKPQAGSRWDTIYFDIWPDICTDDLAEATRLHKRFRKYLRPDGVMDSWCRHAVRMIRR